ncbi:glycosyl hydrolase family 61-domain-containing protein [Daedaleopsis nitida]|nr:glycosyl hydrolase family 61-domain-containing protein [Daedaleopsis nitida]
MFSKLSLAALAAALVAPSANAHGFVHSLEVGGKNYSGWLPFTDPYESPVPSRIVRKIPGDGPVMDVTSSDIACNQGGNPGVSAIASAAAGSTITFDWNSWPSDHMGPIDNYMASCDGDCSKLDASKAKWFKVQASGYSDGKWAATKLIENGAKWDVTIPAELAAGEYLIRHQIVALHSAGEPQFYPSCAQLKVTGGGGKTPSGSDLVSIPGVYNSVQWPDIWSDSFKSFTIPGPAVAFSGSSSGSEPSSGSENTESSVPTSTEHTSPTPADPESTKASKPTTTSTVVATPTTSPASTSSAPASTGKCSTKRRRGMVKRRVDHHAKRHH